MSVIEDAPVETKRLRGLSDPAVRAKGLATRMANAKIKKELKIKKAEKEAREAEKAAQTVEVAPLPMTPERMKALMLEGLEQSEAPVLLPDPDKQKLQDMLKDMEGTNIEQVHMEAEDWKLFIRCILKGMGA